ncbi:hypothetical protein EDD86DRAFT_214965 [Gorgonomyces haynaldii]|nr:hypothetical protein EDD86DRAFT_214965 [Gorgonomyces haynaldii]
MTRKALKLLELSDKKDFQTEFFRLKGQITAAKSFRERLLSLKTLHGLSMLVSRINIVGRIFVTPLRSDFECLTYPVYKQVDSTEFKGLNQPLTQVPVHNPNYNKQPWANREVGWMMMLLWGPVGAGLLFAIVYSWFMTRSLSRSQSETQRLIAVQ